MKFACISIEKGSINLKKKSEVKDRVVNIGDHMQLIAIMNLYKYMGIPEEDIVRIEYYDLFDYEGEYLILPINFIYFNPYYGERDLIFSPKIIPVFLGIHCISAAFNDREIDYLKRYAPIGCRDAATLELMRKMNIPSYLHGCLSVTLPKRTGAGHNVFCVDVPKEIYENIPLKLREKAECLSHQFYGNIDGNGLAGKSLEKIAYERLNYYKTAELVITSRLHCAAPCLAMGIPTIFAVAKYSSTYAWIDKFLPVYEINDADKIDFNCASVDIEDYKQKLLDLDATRIRDVFDKYNKTCEISEFYESTERKKFENVYLVRLKKYTERNWKRDVPVQYALWGITQISEVVYNYIKEQYPLAHLAAVFDDYRDLEFHGIKAVRTTELTNFWGICVIATGNSSSVAAQKMFKQISYPESLWCTCYSGDHVDV